MKTPSKTPSKLKQTTLTSFFKKKPLDKQESINDQPTKKLKRIIDSDDEQLSSKENHTSNNENTPNKRATGIDLMVSDSYVTKRAFK